MAALDEGGHCDGVVLHIASDLVDHETEFMWRCEMYAGSYRPVFLEVTTPRGPVDALTFAMDRTNSRYMPDVSDEVATQMIALAEGGLGSKFTYLESLVRRLDDRGIKDEEMRRLYSRTSAVLSGYHGLRTSAM